MRSLLLIGAVAIAGAADARPIIARPAPPPAWGKCTVCHATIRGVPAQIGPNLWGVAGAKAGARPGFAYSAALKRTGLTWTRPTLTRWIDNPQAVAPGTTMPRQALTPAERDALVAYMLRLK